MNANWTKRRLIFHQPAGTFRGIMNYRDVWFITLRENRVNGIGECAPLPGLSVDDLSTFEAMLSKVCSDPVSYIQSPDRLSDYPSIRFGLEMAEMDLKNGGGQRYYPVNDSIEVPINGLIWMGDSNFLLDQIETKLKENWKCIKIKIGALDFETELDILKSIRNKFNQGELELRVDANGAFSADEVFQKIEALSKYDIHSIEQPIAAGQWDVMKELCATSPIPIALDEELIPLISEESRINMLDKIQPDYIVLKPSLLGGFSETNKWIQLAEIRNIKWWVTSALESNIGLNAIFQWTNQIQPKGFQGLGTGKLFTNNIPSSLEMKEGKLTYSHSSFSHDVNQVISEWLNDKKDIPLQTSGSTGKPKSIIVKKDWVKNSVELTKDTFHLKSGDSALLCLPVNYIAGKMMVIRAIELGLDLTIKEPSVNPLENSSELFDFAAMTPYQAGNLIEQLSQIKTLLVGGAEVSSALNQKLQPLTTKVYETYGMTETLTHVAIKRLNGDKSTDLFQALDGVLLGTDERGCGVIYAPKVNPSPIITNDLIKIINSKSFQWLGRYDRMINSGGVKIIPEQVEEKLESVIDQQRYFITGIPDEKLGQKVVLIIEGEEKEINFDTLNKYEKPKEIFFVSKFVETHTGKIDRIKSLQLISELF